MGNELPDDEYEALKFGLLKMERKSKQRRGQSHNVVSLYEQATKPSIGDSFSPLNLTKIRSKAAIAIHTELILIFIFKQISSKKMEQALRANAELELLRIRSQAGLIKLKITQCEADLAKWRGDAEVRNFILKIEKIKTINNIFKNQKNRKNP